MQRLTQEQWEAVMAAADDASMGEVDMWGWIIGQVLAKIRDTIGVETVHPEPEQPTIRPDTTVREQPIRDTTIRDTTVTLTQRSGREMQVRAVDITDVRASGAGASLRVRGQLMWVNESAEWVEGQLDA